MKEKAKYKQVDEARRTNIFIIRFRTINKIQKDANLLKLMYSIVLLVLYYQLPINLDVAKSLILKVHYQLALCLNFSNLKISLAIRATGVK